MCAGEWRITERGKFGDQKNSILRSALSPVLFNSRGCLTGGGLSARNKRILIWFEYSRFFILSLSFIAENWFLFQILKDSPCLFKLILNKKINFAWRVLLTRNMKKNYKRWVASGSVFHSLLSFIGMSQFLGILNTNNFTKILQNS